MKFVAAMAWVVLVVAVGGALAEVKTERVVRKVGGREYADYLVYDDAGEGREGREGRRPAVIVVHEWWGLNDYAKARAKQLAEEGYVALAVDMYGDGKTTEDPKTAGEWSGAIKADTTEAIGALGEAIRMLRGHERVDRARIGAIGYCFGGTVVLELARSGADVAGVVSFHGGLRTARPAKAGAVKAKVLVCNGADDGFVSKEEIEGFAGEMGAAGADWEMIQFGGAIHSFTNPNAGAYHIPGIAYHAAADRRSWRAMRAFFEEAFGLQK